MKGWAGCEWWVLVPNPELKELEWKSSLWPVVAYMWCWKTWTLFSNENKGLFFCFGFLFFFPPKWDDLTRERLWLELVLERQLWWCNGGCWGGTGLGLEAVGMMWMRSWVWDYIRWNPTAGRMPGVREWIIKNDWELQPRHRSQHQWWVTLIICPFFMVWWEQHFPSVVFYPITHHFSLIMRKTSDESQRRDILQDTWQASKLSRSSKNKECFRNCYFLEEEPKETWLSAMWYPGLDSRTEKWHDKSE